MAFASHCPCVMQADSIFNLGNRFIEVCQAFGHVRSNLKGDASDDTLTNHFPTTNYEWD